MEILERFAGLNGIIIIILVLIFLGVCVFLKILREKEAESYRKAVLADLKEPKETHTFLGEESRKARSAYTRNARIVVQLNDWATHARNSNGDFDCVLPDVKMTVDFIGVWDNKEKMDSDLDACIKKLLETYRAHISGELLSGGNDQSGYDRHEDGE